MAQYGYGGGYVPNTGYTQAPQYQTSAGIAPNNEYGHGGAYATTNTLPGNTGYSGLPGAGVPQHDNNGSYSGDSMTPDPSSGTLTNVSPATYQGAGQQQNPSPYTGVLGNPAIGNSPSPANDTNAPNFRWWIPSEGISRAILQKNIQQFLGRDAVARPGAGRDKNDGIPGYWIAADQTFTTHMIRDMKEQTLKDPGKRRRDDRDYPNERRDDRREDWRDERRDDRRFDRDRYDREPKYDPRRDARDPKYKPTGVTPPPQPGLDHRDPRYSDDYNPRPQRPYGQPGFPPQYPAQQPSYPQTQPYGQNAPYGQYPTGTIPPPGLPGFPHAQGVPYSQGQGGYQDPRATAGYPGGYAAGGVQHQTGQYPASSPQAPAGYYYASDGNLYQNQY